MSGDSVGGPRHATSPMKTVVLMWGIIALAAAIALLAVVLAPATFSPGSLRNMLMETAPLGLVAMGQCFVILVGGLDLSVASVMATAAVIATSFGGTDSMMPVIVLVILAMAVCVGGINGLLVTKRRVEPFLVTLATMIVLQGIRSAYTQGVPRGLTPPAVRNLGNASWHGIPVNAVAVILVTVVLVLLTRRTGLGRRVYIVGNSPAAARLVGINVHAVTIFCYIASSVLAALGGLVLAGYLEQIDNWVGRGYELDSIVAAVLGGAALNGGRGSVIGALAGAGLLTLISNLVLQLGYPVQVQMIIKGAVVLFAVAVYARRPLR